MMTTTRSYGYNYDHNRTTQDDAKNMRRHITTMKHAGLLPADWKYSVRYSGFSGGCSVDITATSPRPIYAADPDVFEDWTHNHETGEDVHAWRDRLTREARTVLDTLEELHRGHNHDGSDTQTDYFDVKFYGNVTVATAHSVPQYDQTQWTQTPSE